MVRVGRGQGQGDSAPEGAAKDADAAGVHVCTGQRVVQGGLGVQAEAGLGGGAGGEAVAAVACGLVGEEG